MHSFNTVHHEHFFGGKTLKNNSCYEYLLRTNVKKFLNYYTIYTKIMSEFNILQTLCLSVQKFKIKPLILAR